MKTVTVEITLQLPINKVWEIWTTPAHITKWNFASQEWHCPSAEIELVVGGKFSYKMAAKDGSVAFDYSGTFDEVSTPHFISFTLDDERQVKVEISEIDGMALLKETFEPEDENSIEIQKTGWQMILNNFKEYAEKTVV